MSLTAGSAERFDRELSLPELFKGVPTAKLAQSLAGVVGVPTRLVSPDGGVLFGPPAGGPTSRVPVRLEFEAIGVLECEGGDPARLAAAAHLLEVLLDSRALYLMAADLHVEAMRADYEELQRRHCALQDSETRYRELSEQLEARVRQQVAVIDEKQRQLYQAEKLASIGQLAAGVAHEINNPLGFIRSNLETARGYLAKFRQIGELIVRDRPQALPDLWRQLDLDFVFSDFADLLAESVSGADRVARIVADLKGFSSIDRPEEALVDLNQNLESVCSVVAGQLPRGVRLTRQLHTLPPLLCLPGHMNQVFLNILLNAMQAVGSDGEIRVESDLIGEQIRVRITDSGCGIGPDALPRIFEPFFTTREVGRGTGLGLTVARDIVQAHGGRIEAESTPGAGSAFTIHLPL